MTAGPQPGRTVATLVAAAVASFGGIAAVIVAVLVVLAGRGELYAVATDSMAPTVSRGDLVFVQPAAAVAVGDVVTFRKHGQLVTHRLVAPGRAPGRFETRGDANPGNDPWTVTRSDIVGRVETVVPRVGWLLLAANTPLTAPAALAVVLGLVGGWRWAWPRAVS